MYQHAEMGNATKKLAIVPVNVLKAISMIRITRVSLVGPDVKLVITMISVQIVTRLITGDRYVSMTVLGVTVSVRPMDVQLDVMPSIFKVMIQLRAAMCVSTVQIDVPTVLVQLNARLV